MGVDAIDKRAVFLDRDGVINRAVVRNGKPYPPRSVAELEILPGVRDALTRLREAGFDLLVVTNQPDVARGIQTREEVEAIHERIQLEAPVDAFLVCYHDDRDACNCRKPAPGLLLEAAKARGIDLERSYLIGDRWRDIVAAQRAGCDPVFIDYGYAEQQPDPSVRRVASLAEAADWILQTTLISREPI